MKTTFREYHTYVAEEMKKVWQDALIVVDTNVILDFYCFGQKTLDDYYSVLEAIKSRGNLWMPHQVGYEFYENRVRIINKQLKQYEKVVQIIDQAQENIAGLDNNVTAHSHLDFKKLAEQYETRVKVLKSQIERLKLKHPDHLSEDTIVLKLEDIYTDELVGDEYDKSKRDKIYKEGAVRYENKVPPGYKDQKKDDGNDRSDERKYGDLLIWKQILDKAKEVKKPVIFVTNDAKEDWVSYTSDKRKLGPKSALRKELIDYAGVDFFLFSSDEFLATAHIQFNLKVEESSVKEVKRYRELENARIHDYGLRSSDSGMGIRRLPSFHARLHRCKALANKMLVNMEKGIFPERAYDTLRELIELYDLIQNIYRHAGDPQRINDYLDRSVYLIQRYMHIVKQIDEELALNADELAYRNRSLQVAIRRDSYPQETMLF